MSGTIFTGSSLKIKDVYSYLKKGNILDISIFQQLVSGWMDKGGVVSKIQCASSVESQNGLASNHFSILS